MRHSLLSMPSTSLLIALVAGCGPAGAAVGGGGATGTGGIGGAGPPQDALNCGVETFPLRRGLPPDLLIVLDRSGSMNESPASGGASKWAQATTAINMTVAQLQSSIKFG